MTMRSDVAPPGNPACPVSLGFFFNTPASSSVSSSWRPGHLPAAEHMRMRMVYGLPSLAASIEHNPITAVGDALGYRDLMGLGRHLGQQTVSGSREAGQIRIVRLGNY